MKPIGNRKPVKTPDRQVAAAPSQQKQAMITGEMTPKRHICSITIDR